MFPALERRHRGVAAAYFDGPGGTQVPTAVADAVSEYLLRHNANTHWAFPTSVETDSLLAAARAAVADFLGARPNEVSFGANMTTITFHVARAIGWTLGPGDEIVVTELDHQANVAPWKALERERGVTVKTVGMDPDLCQLCEGSLSEAIGPKTRVLAIGAASNAFGTINDVRAAADMAHAAGASVFVDAVHYAPHVLTDVGALGCDLLACSAYKFYGPHVGILYGRGDLLQSLEVPKLDPAPDTAPERLETGTQNHEGIVGAGAAVDFLAGLAGPTVDDSSRRDRLRASFEALHARSARQVDRLVAGLSSLRGVRVFGPPAASARTPTVSFTVAGTPSVEVARALAEAGVFVSHGDFYASVAVRRLGIDPELGGLVRAGCACYTEDDEVERLISGVASIAARR
jgi:cysteine desulfurase family protein (TIGR01976 family)